MAPLNTNAEARRLEIVRLLLERETITVRELSERFGVSAMTAHRDLDTLQSQGVLRKIHGGATAQPSGLYESTMAYRQSAMGAEKRAVARQAVTRVVPGSSVLLDDSTTCLEMLPFLADVPELTIVTNFVSILEFFSQRRESPARLVVIGGIYDPKYHSLLGITAERALLELRVDQCFLSVPAVDAQHGLFHQDAPQARLKSAMIDRADSAFLLVDHSKLGKRALHRIVGLDRFDAVIVDDGAPREALDELGAVGVRLEIAPRAGGDTARPDSDSRQRNGGKGRRRA